MKKKLFLSLLPFVALALSSCFNGAPGGNTNPPSDSGGGSGSNTETEPGGGGGSGGNTDTTTDTTTETDIGFKFYVGSTAYTLSEDAVEPDLQQYIDHKYSYTGFSVFEDDVIKFTLDGVELSVFSNPEDAANFNNTKEAPGQTPSVNWTVHNSTSGAAIYLQHNVDNGGSYSFWLTGGTAREGGGGGGGGEVTESSYSIVRVDGSVVADLTKHDQLDHQNREQFYKNGVVLTTGDEIALKNNSTGDTWIPPVEPYSFGGTSDTDTTWTSYLTVGVNTWTVRQDCTVDIFAKFAWENDSIYFGLSSGHGGGGGGGETHEESGFALADPTTHSVFQTLLDGGLDPNENPQLQANNVSLMEGEEFALYDLANETSWICAIEETSFDGNVSDYLRVEDDKWVVLQDCTVDIYVKLIANKDYIYFDLVGEGGGGETTERSYSIVKADGTELKLLVADGKDDNDKDQFKGDDIVLTAGDEICLKNNKTSDTWIPPVEGWSFGGKSDADETWKTYLEVGVGKWTVLKDCTVDVYAKFAWEADSIYFELSTGTVEGDVTGTVAGEAVQFAKSQDADPELDQLEKWEASELTLKAGDEIVISVGGVQVNLWRNSEDETNVSNVQEGPSDKQVAKVTVLNDAADATIYIQKNPDNSVSIWVTGWDGTTERTTPVVETNYYLVGTMTEWELDEELVFVVDEEDDNKFTLDVTLEATDEFKVKSGETWFGNDSTWDGCGFTLTDGDKNISPVEAGEYTIEFYVDSENNNHIVLVKKGTVTPVVETNYYLVGTMTEWELDEELVFVVDEEDDNKFTLDVTLEATDEFKVKSGETWFGNDSTWDGCGFTLTDGDKNISPVEAGEYTIEFYVDSENNNHIVLVKKGTVTPVDPTEPTEEKYTLTFENVDYGTVQGQGLFVTGQFAGWAAQEAYRLTPNGTKWSGEFTLPAGTEYKLIVAAWEGGAATTWQPDAPGGGNYVLNENTTVTAW